MLIDIVFFCPFFIFWTLILCQIHFAYFNCRIKPVIVGCFAKNHYNVTNSVHCTLLRSYIIGWNFIEDHIWIWHPHHHIISFKYVSLQKANIIFPCFVNGNRMFAYPSHITYCWRKYIISGSLAITCCWYILIKDIFSFCIWNAYSMYPDCLAIDIII